MSTKTAYLAMLLDAPLQSWGLASRFQRRTTGLHPTKSGVVGLVCAALGLAKGSDAEKEMLPRLADLAMTCIAIPRKTLQRSNGSEALPIRRLEDFHTVLNTRLANGKLNKDAVITHRQYLLDACFGVILTGDRELLERVASALQNPVWGIWFGRKNCIPAGPIFRGLFNSESKARDALIGDRPIQEFTTVTEIAPFEEGTDSFADQPVSYGDGTSSGPDKRQFAVRRVNIQSGRRLSVEE